MMAPKNILLAEQKILPEVLSLKDKARKALLNSELSDEEADSIIVECNSILQSHGMPFMGLISTRDKYKNR